MLGGRGHQLPSEQELLHIWAPMAPEGRGQVEPPLPAAAAWITGGRGLTAALSFPITGWGGKESPDPKAPSPLRTPEVCLPDP